MAYQVFTLLPPPLFLLSNTAETRRIAHHSNAVSFSCKLSIEYFAPKVKKLGEAQPALVFCCFPPSLRPIMNVTLLCHKCPINTHFLFPNEPLIQPPPPPPSVS